MQSQYPQAQPVHPPASHRRLLAGSVLALSLGLGACSGSSEGDESPTPWPDASPTPTVVPTPVTTGSTEVTGGDVSGSWCGDYLIKGDVKVPSGSSLMVCAGSGLHFESSVGMRVEGTLHLMGESGQLISLDSASGEAWDGLTVSGTLHAAFMKITGASVGITGQNSSTIGVEDSEISNSNFTLQLSNGGSFERTQLKGGNTVYLYGGSLSMVDTLLDLEHPTRAPDCLNVSGGNFSLDHSRITGCHCPLHITATADSCSVTNSILDGASDPLMIANTVAVLSGNTIDGTEHDILDIGGTSTGISAVVSGNYWGGGAPDISTSFSSQFVGAEDYLSSAPEGVGPRL